MPLRPTRPQQPESTSQWPSECRVRPPSLCCPPAAAVCPSPNAEHHTQPERRQAGGEVPRAWIVTAAPVHTVAERSSSGTEQGGVQHVQGSSWTVFTCIAGLWSA